MPKSHGIGGPSADTGNFDHVTFTATGIAPMRDRLRQRGIRFREQYLPETPIQQIFLEDPNRVMIELNSLPELTHRSATTKR